MSLAIRPGYGTLGQPVSITTNHYSVSFPKELVLNQYDVVCEYVAPVVPASDTGEDQPIPRPPPKMNAAKMKQIWASLVKQKSIPDGAAFDGSKLCYSRAQISDSPITVELSSGQDKPRRNPPKYIVRFRETIKVTLDGLHDYISGKRPIDGGILAACQAINVLISHTSRMEMLTFGNLIFGQGATKQKISNGLEIRGGLFQSFYLGNGMASVNLDVAYTAFKQSGPLLGYLRDSGVDPGASMRPQTFLKIKSLIRGLAVTVDHLKNGRVCKVKDITDRSAEQEKFNMRISEDKSREISIAAYFNEKYNIKLRYPGLPCVVFQRGDKYPLEVLSIAPDQKHRGRLTESQTADTIKISARPPVERLNEIQRLVRKTVQHSGDPILESVGIKISDTPLKVEGRFLPSVQLQYGSERKVDPRDGSWNMNGIRVCQGVRLESFGLLIVTASGSGGGGPRGRGPVFGEHEGRQFLRSFASAAQNYGVSISSTSASSCPIRSTDRDPIDVALRSLFEGVGKQFKSRPQLIFVVLPDSSSSNYALIKATGDVSLGVSTQCMQRNKIGRPHPSYLANVSLKINMKVPDPKNFAYNMKLSREPQLLQRPTMIVGIDVEHGHVGGRSPSIAAMVSTTDRNGVRYRTCSSLMADRTEIIPGDQLREMMHGMLSAFQEDCQRLPERILVYRDGVSDGEFAAVREQEIGALREAFARFDFAPKLTFVISKKRHHTRFFPTDSSQGDRSGNARAGFVVDKKITSPNEYDFFLQSQAGLQGTSRPTRYCVVVDEIGLSVDELQVMTFGLCHTQQRCTRSIGVCAPVFYADLVCARSRLYLKAGVIDDSASLISDDSAECGELQPVHDALSRIMYFL